MLSRLILTLLALVFIVAHIIGANHEEQCGKVYELVFGKNQERLLPQVTTNKLVWLFYHCEFDESRRQKISEYLKHADMDLVGCNRQVFDQRFAREVAVSYDTNVHTYASEYNQFFYEICHPLLVEKLNASKKMSSEQRIFTFQAIDTISQVTKSVAHATNFEKIRLKTAFLLMKEYGGLSFMKDNKLSVQLKRELLFKLYQSKIKNRCVDIMGLLFEDLQNFTRLQQFAIHIPSLSNFWTDLAYFCSDVTRLLTEDNIEEQWKESNEIPLDRAQDLEKFARRREFEYEVIDRGFLRKDEIERVKAEQVRELLVEHNGPIAMSPQETLAKIRFLRVYYEKHGTSGPLKSMQRYESLAMTNLSQCWPKVMLGRSKLSITADSIHLAKFFRFYQQLQVEMCLDIGQVKLVQKFLGLEAEKRDLLTKLGSLAYSASLRSNELTGDYRIHAALNLLMQEANLIASSSVSQRSLFGLFHQKIKIHCDELLLVLDRELKLLNIVLQEEDEDSRGTRITNTGVKLSMFIGQVCLYLSNNVNEKKLFKIFRRKGAGPYNVKLDYIYTSEISDLREIGLSLHLEPEFNKNLTEIEL